MAAERFIEIPALHQTAVFRRAAIDEVLYIYALTIYTYCSL